MSSLQSSIESYSVKTSTPTTKNYRIFNKIEDTKKLNSATIYNATNYLFLLKIPNKLRGNIFLILSSFSSKKQVRQLERIRKMGV